jgi:glycosyltransferase involved in cell wall biosynthesis
MHKPLPRVSIVVPAYNEAPNIGACLQAIAAQTVQPYEVIVVDNNCTDDTVQIAATYPFVRIVKAHQQGIVWARNAGFDAACGEVIARIDADIIMPVHWLDHISQFYRHTEHDRLALSGSAWYYNIPLPGVASKIFDIAFRGHRLLIGSYALWGSSMALTRAQWQSVRPMLHQRNDIHEDLDLALHLHEAGYTVRYDPTFRVEAELRRVYDNRRYLWRYLQWYPRALRLHGKRIWPLCWVFGVPGLYCLALLWVAIDAGLRTVQRPALHSKPSND